MTTPISTPSILLTGATGNIGKHVDRALTNAAVTPRLFGLNVTGDGNYRGDIRDPDAVFYATEGCDTIIHCASYIGGDPSLQKQLNVDGTANLLYAARRRGVRKFLYLSTAGVYGGALGHGRKEGYINLQPGSSSAQSRAIADFLVRERGGTVIRPNLVHGEGDTTTIPPLLAAMTYVGAWIGNPGALISVISAEWLGNLIAGLALAPQSRSAYHAAFPNPISLTDLLSPIYEHAELPLPDTAMSAETAATRLAPAGVSTRQIAMIAADTWFNSDAIWNTTSLDPPRHALEAAAITYYAAALQHLTQRAETTAG